MKTITIIFLTLITSIHAFGQNKLIKELRFSYLGAFASIEPSSAYVSDATPTYLIQGFDVKFTVPSSMSENLNWLLGSAFVYGYNYYSDPGYVISTAATYGGMLYFGPELITKKRFVQLSTFITGGLFSFHDDILEHTDGSPGENDRDSDFTAPGVKSGINIKLNIRCVNLNIGYQAFATAGGNSTQFRHGPEFGIGLAL